MVGRHGAGRVSARGAGAALCQESERGARRRATESDGSRIARERVRVGGLEAQRDQQRCHMSDDRSGDGGKMMHDHAGGAAAGAGGLVRVAVSAERERDEEQRDEENCPQPSPVVLPQAAHAQAPAVDAPLRRVKQAASRCFCGPRRVVPVVS